MASRAIWKGTIRIGRLALPVKLYSAVREEGVHFRLLHRADLAPVAQKMVASGSDEPVEPKAIRKAFPLGRNELVMLDEEDLQTLEPEESRDIEITRFVRPDEIDHRWYERAYYLGPDGDSGGYFAAAAALERKKREGIAKWVMRKREYVGALRAEDGYLVLITLRHTGEVIDVSALPAPAGRPLQRKELAMAAQLVAAREERFDITRYRDEYRARVLELVEEKARGGKVKVRPFRPRKTREDQLTRALEASLAGVGKKKRTARG
ncbi:MAG TPA: Ku protein [Thermoanaerobaculia bacterium]|nr:Ku protein [Thermoanaerobaculia bacterium]